MFNLEFVMGQFTFQIISTNSFIGSYCSLHISVYLVQIQMCVCYNQKAFYHRLSVTGAKSHFDQR